MRLDKMVREEGDKIKCEAEPGDGGKHAGMIVFNDKGKKEVLGKTDPLFETAEEAVDAAQKSVDMIRSSMPVFKAAEEEKPKRGKEGRKKDSDR